MKFRVRLPAPNAPERWLANPRTPAETELREALDQAAARTADEVALRRVWARLSDVPNLVPSHDGNRDVPHDQFFDPGRARRGRWAWIVAASLAGATATLAFMLVETKSEFRAERGTPTVTAPARETAPPDGANGPYGATDQRSTLVAPATVRTGFGEILHLSLRGGTQVTVNSESTLVLDDDDRPAVSVGEVQFQVPHQPAGQTFVVTMAAYRVVVVGTRFRVRVDHADAAVNVDEGVVEIWSDHRIARVGAGGAWVSRVSAASDSDRGARTAKSALAVVSRPVRLNGAGSSMRAQNSSSRSAARSASLRGPASTRAARETLALATPAASSSWTSATVGASAGATSAKDVGALRADAPQTSAPAVGAPPSLSPSAVDATPLGVQARSARAAGDSRRALGLYRALVQKGGATGENAEYEIGRLLRDGLHQPREAVAAWRSYRAQHPRGLLRIEADISVIETLVSLGDKTSAIAEASDFMSRYPDSERRAEIARLAGDLLRERGACNDAVAAYDVALASAHGRRDVADSSSFHRAVCLMRGDRATGLAALETYLASYPTGKFRGEARRILTGAESPQRGSASAVTTGPSAVTNVPR